MVACIQGKVANTRENQPIPINSTAIKIFLINSTLIIEGVINALSMLSLHMHDISRKGFCTSVRYLYMLWLIRCEIG